MNETRSKKKMPGWARFIVYPLVGMLVALVLNVPVLLFPGVSVEQFPLPPSPARAISSIENYGFHYSIPGITGQDGGSYTFHRFEPDLAWQEESSQAEFNEAAACDRGWQQRLEKEAGALADCRQIQEWGEFCPGPAAAYGIDQAGGVWLLLADTACTNAILVQVILLAGIGLIAAVFYTGWVFIRRRSGRSIPENS